MLAQASKAQQINDITVLRVLKLIIMVLSRNNIQEILALELVMNLQFQLNCLSRVIQPDASKRLPIGIFRSRHRQAFFLIDPKVMARHNQT